MPSLRSHEARAPRHRSRLPMSRGHASLHHALAALMLAALTACGGGGDDGGSKPEADRNAPNVNCQQNPVACR